MLHSLRLRVGLLVAVTVAALGGYWILVEPHAQPVAYHDFADQQTRVGVPHGLNVLSNGPFIFVGLAGIAFLWSARSHRAGVFLEPCERLAYWVYFVGLIFTGLGSMYYHANPNNDTLVGDRLFLAVTFMALFTAMLMERVHLAARHLLWPLVVFGAGSVLYWHYTEQIEAGDLRFYFAAQFFPLLALPIMLLLYPPRYTGTGDLAAMLLCYGLAKGVEILDREIYSGSGLVSGHTLKHLIASAAAGLVLVMLWRRRPVAQAPMVEPNLASARA